MRQSSKQNVLKVTKPVSLDPITTIKQITENASAWPVINGVKQKDGVCYCDGSTLDNSSGKYDDFLAANGSLTVPNGPFRTSILDEGTVTVTDNRSMTTNHVNIVAYTDTSGNWRLKGNIRGSKGTNSTETSLTVTISGVTFPSASTDEQSANISLLNAAGSGVTGSVNVVRVLDNSSNIFIGKDSTSYASYMLDFDVALDSKPTWADANLESYPVINLQRPIAAGALGLPPATATEAGAVSKQSEGTFTAAFSTGFSSTQNTTVRYGLSGSVVTLYFPSTIGTSSGSPGNDIIASGALPTELRPTTSVTQFSLPVLRNNGQYYPGGTTVVGQFTVTPSGSIIISKVDGNLVDNNFTASSSIGFAGFIVSYPLG